MVTLFGLNFKKSGFKPFISKLNSSLNENTVLKWENIILKNKEKRKEEINMGTQVY